MRFRMDEEAHGGVCLLAFATKLATVTWVPPPSVIHSDRDAGNAELMRATRATGGQWRATLPWLTCTNSRNSRSRDS